MGGRLDDDQPIKLRDVQFSKVASKKRRISTIGMGNPINHPRRAYLTFPDLSLMVRRRGCKIQLAEVASALAGGGDIVTEIEAIEG
jgi:hypothetical protein